jgi:hypothetical protein
LTSNSSKNYEIWIRNGGTMQGTLISADLHTICVGDGPWVCDSVVLCDAAEIAFNQQLAVVSNRWQRQ